MFSVIVQRLFRLICLNLVSGVAALSNESAQDIDKSWLAVFLVSIIVSVSGIALLINCANYCQQTAEFTDLENEEEFGGVEFPSSSGTGDFPNMYPPVDVYSESGSQDLATRLRQRRELLANTAQLRPKVVHVGHERAAGGEAEVCQKSQERAKLDRVLSSVRKVKNDSVFSRNNLQCIKEIGTGWFGKVLQAGCQSLPPNDITSQVIVWSLTENSGARDIYNFLQESAPYREMEHANVLKVIGYCIETSPYLTLLELCTNGDLKSFLTSRRNNIDEIERQGLLLNFACDIAAGLQAMHQANYVHRDIALRNCLVTSNLTVKIGDYGIAEERYKDDYYFDTNGDALPIRWLAPEVISYESGTVVLRHITKDSNLWSFGVVLWELATLGAFPYTHLNDVQVLRQVVVEHAVRLLRPELPVSNLHRMYDLMELCWSSPAQRPSIRQLRIMLLHLHSNKDDPDVNDFDQKWDQMMPRDRRNFTHHTVAIIESDDMNLYMDDIVGNTEYVSRKYNAGVHEYGLGATSELNANLELRSVHDMKMKSPVLNSSQNIAGVSSNNMLGMVEILRPSFSLSKSLAGEFANETNLYPSNGMRTHELLGGADYNMHSVMDFNKAFDLNGFTMGESETNCFSQVAADESSDDSLGKSLNNNVRELSRQIKSSDTRTINENNNSSFIRPSDFSKRSGSSTTTLAKDSNIENGIDNTSKSDIHKDNRWNENEISLEDMESMSTNVYTRDTQLPILGQINLNNDCVNRPVSHPSEDSAILNGSFSSNSIYKANSQSCNGLRVNELVNGIVLHENGRIKFVEDTTELALEHRF